MKLQQKIPLYVIAVMLAVGGVGAYAILASQKTASTQQFEATSLALTDTIRNGLEQDMLRGDRDHVKVTLDNLARHETIRSVDIISTSGQVWVSSKDAGPGTLLADDVNGVLATESGHSILGDPENGYMTVVASVPAQPQCLQCHGSIASGPNAAGNLGAIRADIGTTYLEESLALSRLLMLIVGGLTFILVAGTLVFLLRRSILSPLARITGAAAAITRGDYEARAPEAKSGNELGQVASAFNRMAAQVERHTQELENANQELERASRMKSQFLANMSHELRTPLNVIIGFSEVLRDTPLDHLADADRQEFCENIISSGYHLLELINDVLDLAKVEAGQMNITPEEFPVASVVQDVISTMQPLAAKSSVQMGVDVSTNLAVVYADINKFKQILYNLTGNAIKFTPKGGSVKITGVVAGVMARFAVTDTGIGIAPSDQERIFSEFLQLDGSTARRFEGTGLGLALTRKFVEMQGGEIWVESTVGMGSTFYFTVPLPQEQTVAPAPLPARGLPVDTAAASTPAVSTPPAPASGEAAFSRNAIEGKATASGDLNAGKETASGDANASPLAVAAYNPGEGQGAPRVLVVEDDPRTADLISLWLTREGYDVDLATDGVEALEKARQREHFAVCLDIMLPRKDGWQVLHQLKNDPQTADVSVIICSALDNPELGFALGAADYCIKPLSRRPLLDKLSYLQRSSVTRRSTPMVLVADADAGAAAATTDILKRQGFNVVTAASGAQARDIALEVGPDIILLDTSLEDAGSYEVISFLGRHPVTVDIPIVVTTSMDISRSDEHTLLEGHVQKVIHKGRDLREQLLSEIFRLEKINPERAKLLDPQTRLFNRRYFDKRLAEELKRAERYSLDLSALLIHLDQPQPGAPDFTETLVALAGMLRGNLRAADPLARFDESSFAVLLPETHERAGYEAAGKIVAMARGAKLQNSNGEDIKITVSVAVAGCDHCQATMDSVITSLRETLTEIQKRGGDAAGLR